MPFCRTLRPSSLTSDERKGEGSSRAFRLLFSRRDLDKVALLTECCRGRDTGPGIESMEVWWTPRGESPGDARFGTQGVDLS